MQLHLSLCAGILARAARDDKDRIPGVIEGTVYRDHPVVELERPDALPTLAYLHAHAVAVVRTHLGLVGGIVHRVRKDDHVTERVALGARTHVYRVLVDDVLDEMEP